MPHSRKKRSSSSSRSRSGDSSSSRRDRKIRSYIFRAIIVLAVAAFIGFGCWYGFRLVGKQRAMAAAREYADKKEFLQAALSARRALQISPSDLSANRLMAEMAEAMNTKEAVTWRKTVAEMQPGVAQNYFDWADTAIRFRDEAGAREALGKLDEGGKNTATFHDLSARLAVLSGKTSQVYAHVAAAAQLEPKNENYQLQLAAIQLGSPIVEVRNGALARVEQLVESPKIRRESLRMLIQASLNSQENVQALKFANDLMSGPGGTFEDRMLYLKLLGQMKRAEYWWFLAQLGTDLPEKDEDLVTLLSWMNNNGLSRLTLVWTEELPNDRTERVPVCVSIAEAHALLANWGKLKSLMRFQKWGDLEFQREALQARVARAEDDAPGAISHWQAAVQLASDRKEALGALGRFAIAWEWTEEYTNLLWVIANGNSAALRSQQAPALQQLLKKYTIEGKTRDLLRVFSRMLEIDGKNLNAKNNVAYALLLLNMETERANVLAYEVRNADPANAQFASTYALALFAKDKFDGALKVLQQLDEKERSTPSTALCYGVVLAEKGKKDEARIHLDIAEKSNLLPEERTLAEKARAKLTREAAK